ncbi:MAG: hypothetical protein ABJK25_12340 [Halieaceae bacterium]
MSKLDQPENPTTKYLMDDEGEVVRFADGSPILLEYFENEAADLSSITIQERADLIRKLGVAVPKHLLEDLEQDNR